jgi:hypothetical protein
MLKTFINKIPFTTLNNETASWLLLSTSLVTIFCDLPKSRVALTSSVVVAKAARP